MKVILISKTVEPTTGLGTMTYNHALELHKRDINFDLLLPTGAHHFNCQFSDRVKYVLPNLPLSFSATWIDFLLLTRLFKKVKIDSESQTIIHSIADFPYAVVARLLAKNNKLPFIFTAHGTYSVAPFTKLIDRFLFLKTYKEAAVIMAVSNFTANRMREMAGFDRKINVILNPVAAHFDQDSPEMKRVDLPPSGRFILSVGPLKSRKGMDVLIKALPLIKKEIPDIYLLIVGEGDYITKDNLIIFDKLSYGQLAFLFNKCDVFALTPRYVNHQFEGYGLVYLEAGLYRKPVVGSFSGGVPEAVIDGQTGILVPENDVEATAAAIIKILQNKSLADCLGENNFKLSQERNWDDYINKVIKLYQRILSKT